MRISECGNLSNAMNDVDVLCRCSDLELGFGSWGKRMEEIAYNENESFHEAHIYVKCRHTFSDNAETKKVIVMFFNEIEYRTTEMDEIVFTSNKFADSGNNTPVLLSAYKYVNKYIKRDMFYDTKYAIYNVVDLKII